MLYVSYAYEISHPEMISRRGYGCLIDQERLSPKSPDDLAVIRELAFSDAFGSAEYRGKDGPPKGASVVLLFWSELGRC